MKRPSVRCPSIALRFARRRANAPGALPQSARPFRMRAQPPPYGFWIVGPSGFSVGNGTQACPPSLVFPSRSPRHRHIDVGFCEVRPHVDDRDRFLFGVIVFGGYLGYPGYFFDITIFFW